MPSTITVTPSSRPFDISSASSVRMPTVTSVSCATDCSSTTITVPVSAVGSSNVTAAGGTVTAPVASPTVIETFAKSPTRRFSEPSGTSTHTSTVRLAGSAVRDTSVTFPSMSSPPDDGEIAATAPVLIPSMPLSGNCALTTRMRVSVTVNSFSPAATNSPSW